jgi:hypothetical protein
LHARPCTHDVQYELATAYADLGFCKRSLFAQRQALKREEGAAKKATKTGTTKRKKKGADEQSSEGAEAEVSVEHVVVASHAGLATLWTSLRWWVKVVASLQGGAASSKRACSMLDTVTPIADLFALLKFIPQHLACLKLMVRAQSNMHNRSNVNSKRIHNRW